MKTAVFFASVEGHSRKIAQTIADHLEKKGGKTVLVDLTQPGITGFQDIDSVILAAPIHIGKYPSVFETFVSSWKSELASLPTAFVSVSLSIASDSATERGESRAYPAGLEKRTGWKADRVHHAAGALKYLEYDFFKRYMMRRIARLEGGETDTSKNHELTDWDALLEFIDGFMLEADLVS